MNKNLKPVPADKKKSLGKLPTDVRNKMGYAKKGKMVKDEKPKEKPKKPGQIFIELKTPMKARYGTMAKGDVKKGLKKSSEFKRKLEDFRYNAIKRLRGAQVGPAEEAKLNEMMPSVKDSPSTRESKMKAVKMKLSKLKTGGEMKKPMKAKKGKDVKLMENISKESIVGKGALKTSKKSMGGEMKQGYGAARTSGMGLQDEDLIPGKSMDYYKDLM